MTRFDKNYITPEYFDAGDSIKQWDDRQFSLWSVDRIGAYFFTEYLASTFKFKYWAEVNS